MVVTWKQNQWPQKLVLHMEVISTMVATSLRGVKKKTDLLQEFYWAKTAFEFYSL